MKTSVLIVSYTFPPMKGIGGKRWIKFAKYLLKRGHAVDVISSTPNETETSPWDGDLKGLTITRLKRNFPEIINRGPVSMLEKLRYRFSLFFLKILSKGSYYDKSIFWKELFLNEAISTIKRKGIKNIIVTGPPFGLLKYGAELKEKFPELNFIADIRDPWTWGDSYGFKALGKSRLDFEEHSEKYVVRLADKITVPAKPMLDHLVKKYSEFSSKFVLLPHGFDEEDLPDTKPTPDDNRVKIVYGGTLYEGLESILVGVLETVKKNDEKNFSIDLYASSNKYSDQISKSGCGHRIGLRSAISAKEYLKVVRSADYFLVMFSDKYKDFISAKFYEVIRLGTPLIYIGNAGEVSQFITQNALGYHILPAQIGTELPTFFGKKSIKNGSGSFPIENYSYAALAQEIEGLLI